MFIRSTLLALVSVILLLTLGCGSSVEKAQKDSYKAQENVANERLELVEKYQDCMKQANEATEGEEEATNVEASKEACESYLKAAEALK